jgi:NAD+ synthase (glutamine-hydrolysing)
MNHILVALAQVNVTVGAIARNAAKIAERTAEAADAGAHMVVFPELTLCGYPPEDLVLKPHFLEDCASHLEQLQQDLPPGITTIMGAPVQVGGSTRNAAVIYHNEKIAGLYQKILLPNYGVFDEKRIFTPGTKGCALLAGDARVATHICEDSWFPDGEACRRLEGIPLDAVVNLSASPYQRDKLNQREGVLRATAKTLNTHILYCNLVGGQDELVFDGASMIVAPDGKLAARARQFEEDLLLFELPVSERKQPAQASETLDVIEVSPDTQDKTPETEPRTEAQLAPLEEVYTALQLGLRDYVDKNGFKKVVIALSGGIDSALVAAIAVDALGKDRVVCVTMPSRYSSEGTRNDAEKMANGLGVTFHSVPIQPLFEKYNEELAPLWPDREPDVTEENLQARIRGNIIMALSNKFGWLVLATGNKSELATGYCTLYGDMVGGFAVIKDIPKTLVFELSRWRNEQQTQPVIPPSIIERPPSAELRADQQDTDSLPPYETLDGILARYVEQDMGVDEIIADGFDAETVQRVVRLVDRSEYKRRQGPPGIKITPKAFGRDRRVPITNRYWSTS